MVSNYNFFMVEIFDVNTGCLTSFHSDLDKVKKLPILLEADGCLPSRIDVSSFIFDSDGFYPFITDGLKSH